MRKNIAIFIFEPFNCIYFLHCNRRCVTPSAKCSSKLRKRVIVPVMFGSRCVRHLLSSCVTLGRSFTETSLNLVDSELAKIIARRMQENGLAAMLNDLRACDKFDIMDRLGDIDTPLLAVSGTDDVMTPPKYSQYLVDHMHNARTVTIPGGTHFVFAEKPEEVNRVIEDFLKTL